MRVSKLIQTSALAALAAGLAFGASPASARPERDGEWHGRGQQAQTQPAQQQAPARAQAQPAQREQFQAQRQQWQAQRTQWQQARPQGQDQQARQQWQAQRSQWQGQRNDWQNRQVQQQQVQQQQQQQQVQRQNRQVEAQQQTQRQQRWERNRTYADQNRTRDYGANRGQTYSGTRYQDGRRFDGNTNYSGSRSAYRNGGSTQRWDRNWRSNNRYDWQRYRSTNRNAYHVGRYYAPYRSYSYRRLGIGFSLEPLFYSQNYWISDPWQYRLPDVYGPYRWVRYYDDALLVDVYTGEVVDVIYDFFW